jgi:hypothetical protein
MMNLIQRAQELSLKIPLLKKLQVEKQKLDEYTARRDNLRNIKMVLEEFARIAEGLRHRGCDISDIVVSTQGMRKETKKLADTFRDNRTVIIAPESVATFWMPMDSMPKKVKRELEKAWKSYVESQIPSRQADTLTVLSYVPSFSTQAKEVLRHREGMQNLSRALPQDEDFVRLEKLSQMVRRAWENLDGEGLPPTVLNFLKKAHLNGIPMADMDNAVLEWLRQHNLLGKYIVRAR